MRSKALISITAFFAAFVFSAAFASLFIDTTATQNAHNHTSCFRLHYDTVTADAISDLLRRDIRNGEMRFRQLGEVESSLTPPFGDENMGEYAAIIEKYADESGSMDDGNLPRDVRQAWRKHMRAWKNYAEFLKDANDLDYNRSELEIKDASYSDEINRTWYNVLRISKNYGAFVQD